MVRVNLLRNRIPGDEPAPLDTAEDFTLGTEEESPVKSIPPVIKQTRSLKLPIILAVIVIVAGSAGYYIYSTGWENLPYMGKKPAETMLIADEVSMEEPVQPVAPAPTEDKTSGKPAEQPAAEKPAVASEEKPKSVTKEPERIKRQTPAVIPAKLTVEAKGGRHKLKIFDGIVQSVDDNINRLYITVSGDDVNMELGVNSRTDAALFLRNVRSHWERSNFKAVTFEKANPMLNYTYHSRFTGKISAQSTDEIVSRKSYTPVSFETFRKQVTTEVVRAGMKLRTFNTKQALKKGEVVSTPVQLTVDGDLAAALNLLKALMSSDAPYSVSKVSLLYIKGAKAVLSLYIGLLTAPESA